MSTLTSFIKPLCILRNRLGAQFYIKVSWLFAFFEEGEYGVCNFWSLYWNVKWIFNTPKRDEFWVSCSNRMKLVKLMQRKDSCKFRLIFAINQSIKSSRAEFDKKLRFFSRELRKLQNCFEKCITNDGYDIHNTLLKIGLKNASYTFNCIINQRIRSYFAFLHWTFRMWPLIMLGRPLVKRFGRPLVMKSVI